MTDSFIEDPEERHESQVSSPDFWRGYRVERVGGTVYLENEAGVEAFTPKQAEGYALAILLELHGDKSPDGSDTMISQK